jgi:hypothetical protein
MPTTCVLCTRASAWKVRYTNAPSVYSSHTPRQHTYTQLLVLSQTACASSPSSHDTWQQQQSMRVRQGISEVADATIPSSLHIVPLSFTKKAAHAVDPNEAPSATATMAAGHTHKPVSTTLKILYCMLNVFSACAIVFANKAVGGRNNMPAGPFQLQLLGPRTSRPPPQSPPAKPVTCPSCCLRRCSPCTDTNS